VTVPADDLHGAPYAEIRRLLTEEYMPPEGDPRMAMPVNGVPSEAHAEELDK
jgi:hypothetical protein